MQPTDPFLNRSTATHVPGTSCPTLIRTVRVVILRPLMETDGTAGILRGHPSHEEFTVPKYCSSTQLDYNSVGSMASKVPELISN